MHKFIDAAQSLLVVPVNNMANIQRIVKVHMVLRPPDACVELLKTQSIVLMNDPFYAALLEFEPTLAERIQAHPDDTIESAVPMGC